MAGAVSSLFILIIIVKLGELFRDLPKVSSRICPARLEGLGQARGSGQSGPRRGAEIQGRDLFFKVELFRVRFGVKGQGLEPFRVRAKWLGSEVAVSIMRGYASLSPSGPC